MPDKSTPDWTADEHFWNEAWADMDSRLPRRKRPIIWPWWLGAFVLLVGTCAVWAWNGSGAQTSEATFAQNETRTGIEINGSTPDQVAGTRVQSGVLKQSAELNLTNAVDSSQEMLSPATGGAVKPAQWSAGTPTTRAETSTHQTDGQIFYGNRNADSTAPISSSAHAARPSTAQTFTAQEARPSDRAIEPLLNNPLKLLDVPSSTFELVPPPTAENPQPSAPIHAASRRPLYVFAAGNTDLDIDRPGYTFGVETRLNAGGKWTYPVGLSFRRADYKIEFESGVDGADRLVNTPNTPGGGAQGSNNFNQVVLDEAAEAENGRFSQLSGTSVNVRGGARQSLSPHFSLEAGLRGTYYLALEGPGFVVDGENVDQLIGTNATGRLDLGSLEQDFIEISAMGEVGRDNINRFALGTYLNLNYRIGQRFELLLGGEIGLTPLYRDGTGTRRERVNLGLRWRIR